MNKILKIFSLLLLPAALLFNGCQKEELDIAALTDFPPGIVSIFPADGSRVVIGGFDVKVKFADGTTSPLASAEVSVSTAGGNQLASATKSLTGTSDSLVIAGSSFNAASLPVGDYALSIKVTDSKGQTETRNTTFTISLLPFEANHDNMYLAGQFNGWGADVLTLVAPHIWEIKEVDLQGSPWKIKNCENWCDEDWGDTNCDGRMESNKAPGGNADTNCGYSGLVNIRFNDQTLEYTIRPSVEFPTNITGLYLLGTFNNFEGSEYKFNLTAANLWVLEEILIAPGDVFKFAESPDFMGRNWGDNEGDGKADEFGKNITFSGNRGYYKFIFNDKTLDYSFEFVRFPSIGIIGSATPGGWDTDTDMSDDNGDGVFELNIVLVDGEAKFRADNSWAQNWGASDFPSGVAVQDGPNIPVTAGRYNVTFNPSTGAYNFEFDAGITSVGIIGSATPGGWDNDTNMRDNGNGIWTLIIGLTDGEAKFRANDDWAINWGDSAFPGGTGILNGPNIPVTAGLYLVTFNAENGAYSFAPASIGIIGSATPGGWDTDTNLTVDAVNPAILSLTITLADGEAKFRANDDWAWNWGASGFPSGTGTQDGPNIPITAGNYTIKFNANTGAYSFE